eukprot:TRINITY_DN12174_c0_g2_i1.p1 TRINITY_DN12174_c0_g2~~TRINITY_DN12174_c0_g2_i1.p1  ORF type:complete len:186 (+),score=20.47 TRINITY_DN12174_c0_g2_i1:452-1009(+)
MMPVSSILNNDTNPYAYSFPSQFPTHSNNKENDNYIPDDKDMIMQPIFPSLPNSTGDSSVVPTTIILTELVRLFTSKPKKTRDRLPRLFPFLVCLVCKTTQSPQWRRGPSGQKTLCNACGIKYQNMIKKEQEVKQECTVYKISIDNLVGNPNEPSPPIEFATFCSPVNDNSNMTDQDHELIDCEN